LKGCNVGITDGVLTIYALEMGLVGMMYVPSSMTISSDITVIAATLLEDIILVLLTEVIYDVHP
jgi:hypothetical protein